MNFRETLNKARELNIQVLTLEVAFEVSCEIEDLSEEQFEKVCHLVERAYLKSSNIEVWAITQAIKGMLENGAKIDEICDMDLYEIIDKASWY